MPMTNRYKVIYGTSTHHKTDFPPTFTAVPIRTERLAIGVSIRRVKPKVLIDDLPHEFFIENIDEQFMGGIESKRYKVLPPLVPGGSMRDLDEGTSGAVGYGPNAYYSGILSEIRPDMVNLENDAMSKLFEQIRGDLDLAIDIAEFHQTKSLMKDVLKIDKFIRNIPAVFRSGPIGAIKAVGSLWLTWQYGVRPLLSSVYGTVDQILNGDALDSFMTIKVRKSRRRVSKDKKAITAETVIAHIAESRARVQIMSHWKFRAQDSVMFANFSSLNPVSIAWEILPFSFVADWFLNVGQYLRNAESSALYGTSFKRGCITIGRKEYVDLTLSIASSNAAGYDFGGGVAYYNYKLKDRRVMYSVDLIPNPPRFKMDLGAQRLYSAASLLSNFLKKR